MTPPYIRPVNVKQPSDKASTSTRVRTGDPPNSLNCLPKGLLHHDQEETVEEKGEVERQGEPVVVKGVGDGESGPQPCVDENERSHTQKQDQRLGPQPTHTLLEEGRVIPITEIDENRSQYDGVRQQIRKEPKVVPAEVPGRVYPVEVVRIESKERPGGAALDQALQINLRGNHHQDPERQRDEESLQAFFQEFPTAPKRESEPGAHSRNHEEDGKPPLTQEAQGAG